MIKDKDLEVFDDIVFHHACQAKCKNLPMYLAELKEDDEYQPAVLVNKGTLGSFTFKDLLIFFGIWRKGIAGYCYHCKELKVVCPECKIIQEIKQEYQVCTNCFKKFYTF
jgi:hypothetical protein